jgi:hypothetical protein
MTPTLTEASFVHVGNGALKVELQILAHPKLKFKKQIL